MEWVGHRSFDEKMDELSVWTFEASEGAQKNSMVKYIFVCGIILNVYISDI